MKRIFLWDIDGTLLLSGGAGKEAFDQVFEKLYGEKYIWENLNPDGRTDDLIIEELFYKRFKKLPDPEEMKSIITLYVNEMAKTLPQSANFRLMPYARETLARLQTDKNNFLGLATGNYEESAWHKLKHAELDSYFSFGGFGSDARHRADITRAAHQRGLEIVGENSEVFVIGDTIHDIQCGKEIGALTIAVATGSTSFKTLEQEKPDYLLEDLSTFFAIEK